jgi:hypothetical protein
MRRDWLGGGGNGCLLLKLLGPLAALLAARNYIRRPVGFAGGSSSGGDATDYICKK